MILVDPRIGSADLAAPLAALGLPVETLYLDFGDVAFGGNGPGGTTVQVGIELKRLPDLLSSFASGRLTSHQLPGLLSSFDAVWLVVEGQYRSGAEGILEWGRSRPWKDAEITNWGDAGYGNRRWMYSEVEHRLSTIELKAGVHVKRTANSAETVAAIAALYSWWHSDEWDDHTSHIPQAMKYKRPSMGGPAPLLPPTLREAIAAQLPGIGCKSAAMVAGKFESVRDMVNADVGEWLKLPGIGKRTAQGVVAALTNKVAAQP